MPVPKRKRSRSRRDKRFANKGLKEVSVTSCSNCKAPLATHAACRGCGFYKGMKVLTTKDERTAKRLQERQKIADAKKAAAPQEPVDVKAE